MSTIKNVHAVYATVVAGLLIIVLGAILTKAANYQDQQVTVSPAPSESPSAESSPIADVVNPVVEVTPTPAATPIPTTAPAASMPQSATTFLANFYAAYNSADRDRLETYFTDDATSELRSLRARLFTGKDPEGNPGGPTLFATSSANQKTTGYSVINSAAQSEGWVVTVQEQRVDGDGNTLGPVTTLIVLKPGPDGTWLIDSYNRSGEVGKYSAFLTQ